jgi:hypothetical protein
LHKFLLKLIETPPKEDQDQVHSFINPFPIIANVTKRIIKSIKIYALIALCTKSELKNVNFNEYLNQLFFKINFTGFQQQQQENNTDNNNADANMDNNDPYNLNDNQLLNSSMQNNCFPNYTLKFNYKPGEEYTYENIFSLCLEMGLCSLNEIYDYPFAILFPVLEAINWCRENPCFSWPSYAFDLIGRNDLSILKANTDSISAEQAQYNINNNNNANTNVQSSDDLNEMQQAAANSSSSNSASNSTNTFAKNYSINYLALGKKRARNNRNLLSTATESSTGSSTDNFLSENNLTIHISQNLKKDEEDGMTHVMQLETLKCRFNEDLRIKEVRSCLQTTRPIQIKLNQGPDVSDHDFVEEEEKFLVCICVRTMSLPFGRGIFTLHTINPIPTEPVCIPELNLKGKVKTLGST